MEAETPNGEADAVNPKGDTGNGTPNGGSGARRPSGGSGGRRRTSGGRGSGRRKSQRRRIDARRNNPPTNGGRGERPRQDKPQPVGPSFKEILAREAEEKELMKLCRDEYLDRYQAFMEAKYAGGSDGGRGGGMKGGGGRGGGQGLRGGQGSRLGSTASEIDTSKLDPTDPCRPLFPELWDAYSGDIYPPEPNTEEGDGMPNDVDSTGNETSAGRLWSGEVDDGNGTAVAVSTTIESGERATTIPPDGRNRRRVMNTLRPRQNGRYFADDIFKCIFLNKNVWIPIEISLKFVPKGPINTIPALFQIMAWHRPGDKPLSEPMMVKLKTHICVTRSQWVNTLRRRKMADILQATFSKEYRLVFWFQCHKKLRTLVPKAGF